MLLSAKNLLGYKLGATDDELGGLRDLYFDGSEWVIRYFVAETRRWLPGRLVLISPSSILSADWANQRINTSLSKQQIKDSPTIDEDRPVSKQQETAVVGYYGWPAYWMPTGGVVPTAAVVPVPESEEEQQEKAEKYDANLRSVQEVTGYFLRATDGEIGNVIDFVIDDSEWTIRYLVVDTGKWLPDRQVLIVPQWITSVHWEKKECDVDVSQEQVRNAPEYDPARPVNREYEIRLYDYYGRPHGW